MANTRPSNASCGDGAAALYLATLLVTFTGCTGAGARTASAPWGPTPAPAAVVLPPTSPAAGLPAAVDTRAADRRTAEPDATTSPTIRGQGDWSTYEPSPGYHDGHFRRPLPASGAEPPPAGTQPARQATDQPPTPADANQPAAASSVAPAATPPGGGPAASEQAQWVTAPLPAAPTSQWDQPGEQLLGTPVPIDIHVEEGRTGRFMFGAGINSDAGVTGQIIIDERNFNLFGFPRSWDEVWNGEAFRGGGQGFRIEAIPGNRVQRYLVSFTEPYLLWTPISLNVSGFYYDRGYFDWDENRVGGRLGLGYRLSQDLSVTGTARGERVKISDIRVPGIAALDEVQGNNELYSGKFTLRHDTRDLPFMPTEGHLIEMSYEQAFGDFDYPRGEVDFQKYFLVRQRPDTSGRHTLSVSLGAGFSGSQTPIFENYFAGGFSTLRGFEFRGASPVERTVRVGGQFRMLGSVQYMLPLTADDMIRAVTFVDFGTVENDIEIRGENFRVAPGFGFRVSIPAMGPAPLAFDFAFPICKADTDETQVFSFFFGFGRG